jgi:hypothetical protein
MSLIFLINTITQERPATLDDALCYVMNGKTRHKEECQRLLSDITERLIKNQQQTIKQQSKNTQEKTVYLPWDKVWISTKFDGRNGPDKFFPRYRGPVKIEDTRGNYSLSYLDDRGRTVVYNTLSTKP